jgi:hypothetical protein
MIHPVHYTRQKASGDGMYVPPYTLGLHSYIPELAALVPPEKATARHLPGLPDMPLPLPPPPARHHQPAGHWKRQQHSLLISTCHKSISYLFKAVSSTWQLAQVTALRSCEFGRHKMLRHYPCTFPQWSPAENQLQVDKIQCRAVATEAHRCWAFHLLVVLCDRVSLAPMSHEDGSSSRAQ